MQISSERLAYWFLRLNGFLTTYNFIVHPEEMDWSGRYPQQTDVDVMGVRFPFRRENRGRPMQDHACFEGEGRTQFVLAETKSARCGLNDSWRVPERQNMQKALSAAGLLDAGQVDEVASSLYKTGQWTDGTLWVRWLFFGSAPNGTLKGEFPEVPQLTWDRAVLPFIFQRFNEYQLEKRANGQWDEDARGLFTEAAAVMGDRDKFIRNVEVIDPTTRPRQRPYGRN